MYKTVCGDASDYVVLFGVIVLQS